MVWTPIPASWVESSKDILSGSVFDVVWKVSVISALVAGSVVLVAAGGFFGGFVAAALLSTLLNDDVRDTFKDVYHRNFWEPEP